MTAPVPQRDDFIQAVEHGWDAVPLCACGRPLEPYAADPQRWLFCERCGRSQRRQPAVAERGEGR